MEKRKNGVCVKGGEREQKASERERETETNRYIH